MKREELIYQVEKNDRFFEEIGADDLAFVWEKHLTSDYWKNWRAKIREFPTDEEAEFYSKKASKLRTFILWTVTYYKNDRYDADYINYSIKQEEKRLQNITNEEWSKIDRISEGVREMSVEEIVKNFFNEDGKNPPKGKIDKNLSNQNIVQQKSNDNHGVKKLGWFFGIVGFFGIIGVICFKRFG